MSNISGECKLIIRGKDNLDFNEIDKKMDVIASDKCKKGYVFSKLAPDGAPSDLWIYSLDIDKDGNVNNALDELLNKIKGSKDFIRYLSDFSDVCIRCFVQSDLAEIGFDLSPSIFSELASLNVRFEMSIISWGAFELD